MSAGDIVPLSISPDHSTIFATGVVRFSSTPSFVMRCRVVSPSPVAFTLSVVNSNVERFSVTNSVDVMEIAETLDGGESVSHSFAGMVSLSKVKVSRVVLENSTSVGLLAEGGKPMSAKRTVP